MSAKLRRRPSSQKRRIVFSPSPSMSMAPREAKWKSPCWIWAGQERLGHRICTSPGGWTTGVPQAGQRSGIANGRSEPSRSCVSGRDHLRDHVAGALDDDPVADAQILAGDVLLVVEGREPDRRPADLHRLERGEGHEGARAPNAHRDVEQPRGGGGGRELVGDGPARRPAHRPEAVLHVHVVDLHHGPVDVEVHRPAAVLPGGARGLHLLDRVDQADVRVDPEARRAQPRQHRRLRGQVEALRVAHPVAPDREGPLGRGRGIELAQAAGGGVARVGEGRQAGLGPGGVELGERGQGQVDLPAHLHHRRRRPHPPACAAPGGWRGWCAGWRSRPRPSPRPRAWTPARSGRPRT